MKNHLPALLLASLAIFSSRPLFAWSSGFCGYARDDGTGEPLSGAYSLTSRACDASTEGTCVGEETRDVTITDGAFCAHLTLTTPSDPTYVELVLNGVTFPRFELVASAFSEIAAEAQSLVEGVVIGVANLPDSGATAGSCTNCSLTVDAKGRVTAASSGTGVGDITAVTAGTGLTGGGLSGDVTLSLSTVPITSGGTGATSAAAALTALGAAGSGANSNITSLTGLTTALSVAQGGTGATSASAAKTALGAASSGANSDITSLTGLTTALPLTAGGTGSTTAAAARTALGVAATGENSDITALTGLKAGDGTQTGQPVIRLHANTTAVTSSGTAETNLMSYTLPANSLSTNGQAVRIFAWGTMTATNDGSRTVKLYFGSNFIESFNSSTDNEVWWIEVLVVRTGASSQEEISFRVNGTNSNVYRETDTQNLANAVIITVTGDGSSTDAGVDQVQQQGMIVEFLN